MNGKLLSSWIRPVEYSQTLLLNEQSRLLEAQGKKVYKFGFGQSPFSPPESVIEALKEHANQHGYLPVQGLMKVRETVAQFMEKTDKLEIHPENIFIGPGSKMLIYAFQAAFTQADVFIPAPAWVSYIPQAKLLGHTVYQIETTFNERWRVTPERLQAALNQRNFPERPALLILNYPGNPDGITYSEEALKALVPVLREHEVMVISDEIYGMVHHEGKHRSLMHDYPEGTIITSGLSKWCGAGGWRFGFMALPSLFPARLKETLLGIASETFSCIASPVTFAACRAYSWTPDIEAYVQNERYILKQIGRWSAQKFQEAGIQVLSPEGGFYLFLDFSPFKEILNRLGIKNSTELCQQILADIGVAILPGNAFGMPDSHLSARFAYVDFDGKKLLQESRLWHHQVSEAQLQFLCPQIYEGVNALTKWVAAKVS